MRKCHLFSGESGINSRESDVTQENVNKLGTFDYVTAFEVLEHVPLPEGMLAAVRSVGNQVLVSIPSTGYYAQRLRLQFGRFPRQWIHHPGEHLRFWTLQDLRLMADLCGYRIAQVTPIREAIVGAIGSQVVCRGTVFRSSACAG